MKKTILLLCSILIFTACSAEEDTTTTPAADSILDNEIFNSATIVRDLDACGKIESQTMREDCQAIVGDLAKMDDASDQVDIFLCQDIVLDRYKEVCEERVQSILDDEQLVEEEALKAQEDQDKVQAALDQNDPDLCDEVADENIKYTCRYNILANQAIEEEDSQLCDDIGNSELAEQCKAETAEYL